MSARPRPEHRAALHLLRRCGALDRAADGWWYAPGGGAWNSQVAVAASIIADLERAGLVAVSGDSASLTSAGRQAA